MKIKQIIFTLMLALFAGMNLNAQEKLEYDQANCEKYRSLYFQYLKQGMYTDAMHFWQMAYDYCGGIDSLDGKFFVNARVGYLKLMDAETDAARKLGYRDTIYWIYDCLILKDNDPDWKAKYASMLVTDEDKRFGKIDTLFLNSIHVMKGETSPTYIRQYFKHLILNKYNTASAETKEEMRVYVIDEYMLLSDYCTIGAAKKRGAGEEDEAAKYDGAQEFMDRYFLQIVKDCESLTGVVDKKIKALPLEKAAKIEKVKSYIALLDKKKCQSSSTYAALMDTLIVLDPTAEAYSITAKFYLENGNEAKAMQYFEKAVATEGAGTNKDKYTYELAVAQYKAGKYSAAYRTAKGVEGEYKGKAMVICGDAIAATANGCGESTFERKANNWLANDYYKRAAAMGESVSTSKYLDRAPSSTEVFENSLQMGSSYSLSCWGESTIIR